MSLRSILAAEGLIVSASSWTIFTCRTCGRMAHGTTNGVIAKPGWHKILRIDGPNAMCPECVKDKDSLEGLAEDGYLDAKIGPEMPFDPSIKSAAAEEKPFGVQLSGRGDDYKTKVVSKHITEDEARKAMAVLKAKMTSTDKAHGAVYKVVKVPAKTAALVLTKGDYIEVAERSAVTPESMHGVPPAVILTKPAVFQFDSYSNWPSDGMLRARRMTWNGIRGNTPTMGKWFKIPPDTKMKKLDNLDDRQVLYNA